tara:strand:- start:681 stop:1052 length:372 start_codon:yes stop_codon:yes gene_type:complete
MSNYNRWVLLEHKGAPNDPSGCHFDLLIEDGCDGCRTWRLMKIPVIGDCPQEIKPLPLHNIRWLETQKEDLSRGRGSVQRLVLGHFVGELPKDSNSALRLELHSSELSGVLEIENGFYKLNPL